MIKVITAARVTLALLLCACAFQSCLKDSHTRTYTVYTPVYKSVAEVRAGIKNSEPTAILRPGKIYVQGNFIFVNEVDKGIHIIDNSNPAKPINKYFVAIPGNLDLAVKGNTLYADQYRDLITIDISNPTAVAVKKITSNIFPNRQYANNFSSDTTKVVVDWIQKDTTVNADDNIRYFDRGGVLFATPSNNSAFTAPAIGISGSTARFTILNNYLYTVTNQNLNSFNITDPQNPVYTNSIGVGWNIETIYPFKDKLFIGSNAGMFIYSVANPSTPVYVSNFTHATACDPVIADDNFAFVTVRTGTTCAGTINRLDVLNIANLNAPVYTMGVALTNPHGLAKDGNTLIICDGSAGLKIFDAGSIPNLEMQQVIPGIEAHDVIMINGNAIVVAANGIYQYDYTNPHSVTLRSKIGY